ncbi:MAG: nucleotidyltransferase domain-containing protein [Candidatus Wallbacteria bacterium]|nr:nucleotidyltransferase domain-containing protein [Candidatus Wallbacteria bacterium]
MKKPGIAFDKNRIAIFCSKWRISEFALFGSSVRGDFNRDSDVDVLITLTDDAPWSLFDWSDMIDELEAIFGRKVDLVEKSSIRNPFRRKHILENQMVLYAA